MSYEKKGYMYLSISIITLIDNLIFIFRMFVKVQVGYGDGERSSPQDLLLYDSKCWHCSPAGECNAKPNNKCVFSAQASTVQSFRIGKSISRTEGNYQIKTGNLR